jgi:hypothetical protein
MSADWGGVVSLFLVNATDMATRDSIVCSPLAVQPRKDYRWAKLNKNKNLGDHL